MFFIKYLQDVTESIQGHKSHEIYKWIIFLLGKAIHIDIYRNWLNWTNAINFLIFLIIKKAELILSFVYMWLSDSSQNTIYPILRKKVDILMEMPKKSTLL
jgi:hypothetical protein